MKNQKERKEKKEGREGEERRRNQAGSTSVIQLLLEVKARVSDVQGYPPLHSNFDTSLGYRNHLPKHKKSKIIKNQLEMRAKGEPLSSKPETLGSVLSTER